MNELNERESLKIALEEILSNKGWIPDENAQLPEQVGWTPDRIFICGEKKLALEIEEEVNIPRFLIRRIKSCRELLQDTKILVAAVRNTPLKFTTARIGIQNDISVYADFRNPVLVLDSAFPEKMTVVSRDSIRDAYERFHYKKRIPLELIRELEILNHILYARNLRQFAHDYESVEFNNWEDEHQFIHDFLTNHFGDQLGANRLFEGLNLMSLLEVVSEVILGKRPHFLHSFQTFLLGSVIIDKNYNTFQQLYSACFESDQNITIDLPWFFTSLFHDVASPFESLESMGPVGELRESRPRGISSVYAPHLLSCLFELLKVGTIDSEWEPEPGSAPGELYNLLSRYRWRDHGVMGALNLISSTQQMNRRTLSTVLYPSALAVSIHNTRLWPYLIESQLFPVSAKKFPLIFLLFLCDNLEEWGREMFRVESEKKEPKVLITNLNFDQFIASFNLYVDEPARAMIIKNRFDWITQILFNIEDLQTQCAFSISSE